MHSTHTVGMKYTHIFWLYFCCVLFIRPLLGRKRSLSLFKHLKQRVYIFLAERPPVTSWIMTALWLECDIVITKVCDCDTGERCLHAVPTVNRFLVDLTFVIQPAHSANSMWMWLMESERIGCEEPRLVIIILTAGFNSHSTPTPLDLLQPQNNERDRDVVQFVK